MSSGYARLDTQDGEDQGGQEVGFSLGGSPPSYSSSQGTNSVSSSSSGVIPTAPITSTASAPAMQDIEMGAFPFVDKRGAHGGITVRLLLIGREGITLTGVDPQTHTLGQLIETHIKPELEGKKCIRLLYLGKTLTEFGNTLAQYGITDDCAINVFVSELMMHPGQVSE
jgi:hypothetical protein